jgi:hypothetical protein
MKLGAAEFLLYVDGLEKQRLTFNVPIQARNAYIVSRSISQVACINTGSHSSNRMYGLETRRMWMRCCDVRRSWIVNSGHLTAAHADPRVFQPPSGPETRAQSSRIGPAKSPGRLVPCSHDHCTVSVRLVECDTLPDVAVTVTA